MFSLVRPVYQQSGRSPVRRVIVRHLVAEFDHRARRLGMALERHRDGKDGHRNAALLEEAHEAPEAGPAAVFVDRLHAHMAPPDKGRSADDLGQEGLGSRVAVEDGVLAAFLVIDDDLQGEPSTRRPLRRRRMPTVAHHVARICVGHVILVAAGARERRIRRCRSPRKEPCCGESVAKMRTGQTAIGRSALLATVVFVGLSVLRASLGARRQVDNA